MSIVQGLACGKPTCPCAKTAKNENGISHCPGTNHGKLQGDKNPSLSITVVNGKPLWHCKAACTQDEVADALRKRGLWPDDETRSERRRQQTANEKRTRWPAHNAQSLEFVSDHVRIDQPDGKKNVKWEPKFPQGIGTKDLALYRHKYAIFDYPKEVVVLVEGEKACDSLAAIEKELGIVTVGTVCGAGTIPCDDALLIMDGRTVILWPDNDEPGSRHMQAIAARLYALGNIDIKVLAWPDAPDKGDAADAVESNVNIADLLKTARPWQPTTFDLAGLLERTARAIRRYIVLNEKELDALSLYVAHSHAIDAAEITAYVSINSAEKGSGKTRLIETLMNLVAKPDNSSHITPSVLIRTIANDTPTLFMDEIDAQFKSGKENSEYIRGILNAGYSRGGTISISVPNGNSWEPKKYNVFCPKVFAGIGNRLPDTVRDRSIQITMSRAAPNEDRERFSHRKSPRTLKPLHDEFCEWATEAVPILVDAEPALPEELSDRAADIWEPLFAIADLAGGNWPERSRAAALVLSAGVNVEDGSLGVMLLKDIKSILDFNGDDFITTANLLTALCAMEESPWGDLRGKAIDNRRLAKELKPYRIGPKNKKVSTSDNTVLRGYRREDFVDAWNRYLPQTDATTATAATDTVAEPSQVALVALVADKSGGGAEEKELWKV